jgi:hypothetical protein
MRSGLVLDPPCFRAIPPMQVATRKNRSLCSYEQIGSRGWRRYGEVDGRVPSLRGWAVLTIIRERPSYASEIGERYVARFGHLLGRRRQLHDGVLPSLRGEGLVEVYYGRGRGGAHYRVSARAATRLRTWLRSPFSEDGDEDEIALEVAVRLLATPDDDRPTLVAIANAYEASVAHRRSAAGPPWDADLVTSILRDEQRAMADADLRWLGDVRDRLGV